MKSAIEKFREAQKERNLKVVFDLGGIPVMLRNIDILAIQEQRQITKTKLYKKYMKDGLHEVPADESKWRDYIDARRTALLEQFKDEPDTAEKVSHVIAEEEKSKPVNEADRLSNEYSTIYAMQDIIPKFLYDPETGKRMFESDADLQEITEMIKGDMDMITSISKSFTELQHKVSGTTAIIKN